MVLYVIRHGKAEVSSHSGRDRDRVLRPKGERQADHLGATLNENEHRPSLIVTSTFRRAHQTSERINTILGVEFVSDTRLCVDEPVSLVFDLIAEHEDHGSVCLVGHNPQLEYLCAALAGGATAPAVRVRTGEAFAFELDPGEPMGAARPIDSIRLGE